ncbi:Uncharacterised protein [Neisseria zoodegmatis]|uniref:Uncharacterized protein n=1 Tax=Neisseria zoodegmatis TaxID=326523 RepID=A0A378WFD8_9NEIS|nr:Uncharacterised protein [Neisseria zoodegmatis]
MIKKQGKVLRRIKYCPIKPFSILMPENEDA